MMKHRTFFTSAVFLMAEMACFGQTQIQAERVAEIDGKRYMTIYDGDQMIAFGDENGFSVPESYVMTNTGNKTTVIEDRYITPYNGIKSVEPLLKSTWGQGAPFNEQTPIINGQATHTGCESTATAQILRYHRYPQVACASEVISYNTGTHNKKVEMNYTGLKFDWDHMRNHYVAQNVAKGTEKISKEAHTTYDGFKINPQTDYTQLCKISALKLKNLTKSALKGAVRFLLFDEKDNYLCLCPVLEEVGYYENNWTEGTSFSEFFLSFTVPSEIANGTYRLYLATKVNGDDTWHISKPSAESNAPKYITVTKHSDRYAIDGKDYELGYSRTEADAVSKLIKAIGVAVRTDYTPNGSGGLLIYNFSDFKRIFRLDEDLYYLYKSCVPDQQWHSILQQQLNQSLPVYYGGSGMVGMGHAFVIDGYKYVDNLPYYHVNWGWNGSQNGYYLLSRLIPDTGEANLTNFGETGVTMLVNLKGEDGVRSSNYIISADTITASKKVMERDRFLQISINNCYNSSGLTHSGTMYLKVKKANTAVSASDATIAQLHIDNSNVAWSSRLTFKAFLPATLGEGEYEFYPTYANDYCSATDVLYGCSSTVTLKKGTSYGGSNISPEIAVVSEGMSVSDPTETSIKVFANATQSLDYAVTDGKLGVLISDAKGVFIKEAIGTYPIINVNWGRYNFEERIEIPKLNDGTYRLYYGFRRHDEDQWSYVEKTDNSNSPFSANTHPMYIEFTSKDGVATINGFKIKEKKESSVIEAIAPDAENTSDIIDITGKKINDGDRYNRIYIDNGEKKIMQR